MILSLLPCVAGRDTGNLGEDVVTAVGDLVELGYSTGRGLHTGRAEQKARREGRAVNARVAVKVFQDASIRSWRYAIGEIPFEAQVFDTEPSTPRLKTALLFESVMEISARTRESRSPNHHVGCSLYRLPARSDALAAKLGA
jgi:hypothetical protein